MLLRELWWTRYQGVEEQATGLAEVNIAVNQMDQVTQQNAAMLGTATAAASSLKIAASEMAALIGEFRIESDGQHHRLAVHQADQSRRSMQAVVVPLRSGGRAV
ncbi:MAG: hypothetical protein EOO38_17440 [Cytophagaceae bacterium]|nr:MAG: hypothetical protein EOO38_17440 [Cytophagaceae bacterium]